MQQVNKYIIKELGTEEVKFFSEADESLIDSYVLRNVSFDPNKYRLDLNFYNLHGQYIETVRDSISYSVDGDVQAGDVREVVVNPVQDALDRGYLGDVQVYYEVFHNLFSPNKDADAVSTLYISELSADRTEIRAKSLGISDANLKTYANSLYNRLNNSSYFSEVYLDFYEENFKVAVVNVMTEVLNGELNVTLKLYEPLPANASEKSQFAIVERIGEPVGYEILREVEIVEDDVPRLKGPNFNIDLERIAGGTTDYIAYGDLLSYPASSSYHELYSLFEENSAQLGIDHSNYEEFIHFSSAKERLENFRWKLGTIQEYERAIEALQTTPENLSQISYYKKCIEGIIGNFDHYDRYLYFESESKAWPKETTTRPYRNVDVNSVEEWWDLQIEEAEAYDSFNSDLLINSIPKAIRENPDNEAYVVFVNMIGQHFDNEWIYAKAVADRYDSDNRLDRGISKDLVKDAIRNFGVTLYESNQNLEGLFGNCLGTGEYITGSESSLNSFLRLVAPEPYETGKIVDGKGSFDSQGDTWDGGFASFIGNVEESPVTGSIKSYVSGTVDGIFSGEISASFDGVLDNFPQSGILDGNYINVSISGSIEGTLNGTINGTSSAYYSGSVFKRSISGNSNNVGASEYQPMMLDTYRKEIYKRIYHNLPFLLKTKGTNRGLRALINCFGIPDDILEIYVNGGALLDSPSGFFGPVSETSASIQRIRTDNTGTFAPVSVVSGSLEEIPVLSKYVALSERGRNYSDDTHEVEIGFDLNKQANTYFKENLRSFDYDDIIGDPRNVKENYGTAFKRLRDELLGSAPDFRTPSAIIRLVRYFDSVLFRSLDQFLPARASVSVGAIVKDNLLHRNKYAGLKQEAEDIFIPDGIIDIGKVTGSDGGAYESLIPNESDYPDENKIPHVAVDDTIVRRVRTTTIYNKEWSTGNYIGSKPVYDESPKYNGELSGSFIKASDGECIKRNIVNGIMVDGNPYKRAGLSDTQYSITLSYLALPVPKISTLKVTGNVRGNLYAIHSYNVFNVSSTSSIIAEIRGLSDTSSISNPNVITGVGGDTSSINIEYRGVSRNIGEASIILSQIGVLSGKDGYALESSGSDYTIVRFTTGSSKFIGCYSGSISPTSTEGHYDAYIGSSTEIWIPNGSSIEEYTIRAVSGNTISRKLAPKVTIQSNSLIALDWNGAVDPNIRVLLEIQLQGGSSIRVELPCGQSSYSVALPATPVATKVVRLTVGSRELQNVPYIYINNKLFEPDWVR